MELVKITSVSEKWVEITDKMIELDIAYAVRGELNSILDKIEKLEQK